MRFSKRAFSFCIFCIASYFMPVHANELTAVEKKAATCFGCHGDKGKSKNPQWPNLAAQQPVYLVNQLKAFKTKKRDSAVMYEQSKHLTEEDINNYGAYFAVQEAATAGGDKQMAAAGKSKAAFCLGCHGAVAEGNGEIPRLAGQHADYLIMQLMKFKNGTRQNTTMSAIAANLSEEDMSEIAAYFASF
jgi:cytochrome c553